MKSIQTAQHRMIHTIAQFFEANQGIVLNNPLLQAANLKLIDKITVLDALLPLQAQDPSAITSTKKQNRKILENSTSLICAALRAYGNQVGSPDIAAQGNYSPSILARLTDNDIASVATNLHSVANDLVADLADYGVTASSQAALLTQVQNFSTYIGTYKTLALVPEQATKDIPVAIKDITDFFKDVVDNLVEIIQPTEPVFAEQYFIARRIDDPAHRAMAMRLNIVADGTGLPVGMVSISFVKSSIARKTTAKGNSYIQNLTEGTQMMRLSKPGYQAQEVEVNIVSGETLVLKVTMKEA